MYRNCLRFASVVQNRNIELLRITVQALPSWARAETCQKLVQFSSVCLFIDVKFSKLKKIYMLVALFLLVQRSAFSLQLCFVFVCVQFQFFPSIPLTAREPVDDRSVQPLKISAAIFSKTPTKHTVIGVNNCS
jgi:hypothetical protein